MFIGGDVHVADFERADGALVLEKRIHEGSQDIRWDTSPIACYGVFATALDRGCLCVRETMVTHVYAARVGHNAGPEVRGDEGAVSGKVVENDVQGGGLAAVDKDC